MRKNSPTITDKNKSIFTPVFFLPFILAVFVRTIPLFWGTEVFDITLYRHQAVSILDHINPYLYEISPAFSTLKQPYVYLPFSMFYAPICLQFSQLTQIPFAAVIKFTPIIFDLSILVILYMVLSKRNEKNVIRSVWLYALCPISILIVSFHGNIMAGPALLTLISYLLTQAAKKPDGSLNEHCYKLSALFLGLAIAWRTYPILLLPAFLLQFKDLRAVFKFALFTVLPIVVTTLPFLIVSPLAMLKSMTYTGVNGIIGWHVIPTLASGSVFLNSPWFPAVKKFAAYLQNSAQYMDKTIFIAVYTALLIWARKRVSLLKLIILIFLLVYFLLTTVAQQYFIWVLPFLFLWSWRAALVYSLAGSFALVVLYWAIYPEMLFGFFPVFRLSVPMEYWLGFISETIFWLVIGGLIITILRRKSELPLTPSSNEEGENLAFSPLIFKRGIGGVQWSIYTFILVLTIFETIYLSNLDPHDPWKIIHKIPIETAQKKLVGGQIVRNMPMPKVALDGNGFVWFDPTDRSLKILDKNGQLKSRLFLKHPETGAVLDICDIQVDNEGFFIVSEVQSGFKGKFDRSGKFVVRLGTQEILAPSAIAISPDGNIALVDSASKAVFVMNREGKVFRKIPYEFIGGASRLESFDIGMDGNGWIYLLDGVKQRVCVFGEDGKMRSCFKVRIFSPQVRLAVSSQGFFSILNVKTTQISFYSLTGHYFAKLENEPGEKEPLLGKPCQVLLSKENKIYIVDAWSFEIVEARLLNSPGPSLKKEG